MAAVFVVYISNPIGSIELVSFNLYFNQIENNKMFFFYFSLMDELVIGTAVHCLILAQLLSWFIKSTQKYNSGNLKLQTK